MSHKPHVRILTALAGLACPVWANAQSSAVHPPAHAEAARVIERLEAERVKQGAPPARAEARRRETPAAAGPDAPAEALPESVRAAFERAYELSWDALSVAGGDSDGWDALKTNRAATKALLRAALEALPPLPRVPPVEPIRSDGAPATDSAAAPSETPLAALERWLASDVPPQPPAVEMGPSGAAGLLAPPFLQIVMDTVGMQSQLIRLRAELKALRARVAALERAASPNPSK